MDFFELKRMVYSCPVLCKTRQQLWHRIIHQLSDGDTGLEFGVWHGHSINYFANACPDAVFHGFDSFEGLPEAWLASHPKGHFKIKDESVLKFAANVRIRKGWFSETIPAFLAERQSGPMQSHRVSFVHIDCDLGSSTTQVLSGLKDIILRDKPLLLFDEFYNYLGFEDHEFLAFLNFATMNDLRFDVLARNALHQQVLIAPR